MVMRKLQLYSVAVLLLTVESWLRILHWMPKFGNLARRARGPSVIRLDERTEVRHINPSERPVQISFAKSKRKARGGMLSLLLYARKRQVTLSQSTKSLYSSNEHSHILDAILPNFTVVAHLPHDEASSLTPVFGLGNLHCDVE